MSAEVSVCFTPDTLGDYADAFAVETQLGRFEVSLRGSRPHPQLTLPEELQVRVRALHVHVLCSAHYITSCCTAGPL
jgi:hypothetical protein